MTFTTFVTRTTFTGPRIAFVRALAGVWWRPVTSSTTGTRTAIEATALSRLSLRRGDPEWSRECRANSSTSNSTVQTTPRTNQDVTVSTRSNSTGHQSSTTPVDRPAATDFERTSRTDACLRQPPRDLDCVQKLFNPAVMAADKRRLRAIRDRLRR